MNKKTQIHQFDPIIYPYKLWIIVDKTPNIISSNFKEYSGEDIMFIDSKTNMFQAFTMPVRKIDKVSSDYGVVLFFRSRNSITYELASHEASHAAKYLFKHIGADITEHEPFEYVIGWIANCIYQVKTNKFK